RAGVPGARRERRGSAVRRRTRVTGLRPCSVIVPTRGRPEQLRVCLESICGSDYDRSRLEIVVVNDGGLQEERAVEAAVRAVQERVEVLLLRTDGLGPAAA